MRIEKILEEKLNSLMIHMKKTLIVLSVAIVIYAVNYSRPSDNDELVRTCAFATNEIDILI